VGNTKTERFECHVSLMCVISAQHGHFRSTKYGGLTVTREYDAFSDFKETKSATQVQLNFCIRFQQFLLSDILCEEQLNSSVEIVVKTRKNHRSSASNRTVQQVRTGFISSPRKLTCHASQ
jgi:hypothetical protein